MQCEMSVAYSQAIEKGQWTPDQYQVVRRLIQAVAPLRLLVWGCGHDSDLWRVANRGGRTLFLETAGEWADRARATGCEVICWQPPTVCGVPVSGKVPRCPAAADWDIVLVDAPPGYGATDPGRELPIRWAADCGAAIVVVHDVNRPWERWCTDHYLGAPSRLVPGGRGLLGIWVGEQGAKEPAQ